MECAALAAIESDARLNHGSFGPTWQATRGGNRVVTKGLRAARLTTEVKGRARRATRKPREPLPRRRRA